MLLSAGVQRFTAAHEDTTLAYLARAPYENVFLSWIISHEPSTAAHSLCIYLDGTARVRGAIFFGRQIVLAADSLEIVDAFASLARQHRFERVIAGPRPLVERYWSRVESWHAAPRIRRGSQPVFRLDRAALRGESGAVRIRTAGSADLEAVTRNSAEMIRQELGYDPRTFGGEFKANVRTAIERGSCWVGERENDLCFFCNAGPRSSRTLQLQGIWTPPELRGRGLASQALHGICDLLLEDVPTLTLYVNAFNTPALKLYDRVGFTLTAEFATLLF